MSELPVSQASLLVIDDDPAVLTLVSLLMGPRVAQLWTSTDPHEGLRLAMTYKPGLILLDNHMPGMLGVEVLAQLRKMPATERIPVIMMSSDSSRTTVSAAVDGAVAGYLLKPCDPEELIEKLSPWLGLPWRRHRHCPDRLPALTPAQARQLEASSLLNVLTALGSELEDLALACRDAESLRPSFERLATFRQGLLQGDRELLGRIDGFEQLVSRNFSAQLLLHPELGGRSPGLCRDNFKRLFARLQQRAEAHQSQDSGWQSLPVSRLRAQLLHPFELLEPRRPGDEPITYRELEQPAPGRSHAIDIDSEPGDRLHVPPLLPELLGLLAANAIRYTARGGRIESRLNREQHQLRLQISDSGRGIPAQDLPRVCDYGYRGSNLADLPGREGIGLTRALQIVSRLGGSLSLATDATIGTRVCVDLPLA